MMLTNKLKVEREKAGMSLSELSKITGISKSTLQRYETGTTKKIPIEAIPTIERALKLPSGFLMGWSDKPQNTPDNALPKSIEQMTAREILERAEELGKTTYDIIGYDGRNTTRTTLTEDEYEKVMGIIEVLRKDNR